jgi:hypothetical protein
MLFLSCYRYSALRLDRRVKPPQPLAEDKLSAPARDGGYGAPRKQFVFYRKKYFCRIMGSSPAAIINGHAVDLALQGRLPGAMVLFRDVMKEAGAEAPACNNLAVIHEMLHERDRAFEMYSRACMLEPRNDVFRRNFLGFLETGPAPAAGK